MQKRYVGNSTLEVSMVGLGCNNFGSRLDLAQSREVIHAALDEGITLFDTADIYGDQGGSERILGEVLQSRRKDVVLATKFGLPMGKQDSLRGGSADYVEHAVNASLRRLRTDWIDLYYLHVPDPETPIEETLGALGRLVDAGKVRFTGCSNMTAGQINAANEASKTEDTAAFICSQDEYSLLARTVETEIIPELQKHGMGLFPYFPLASGLLSGKYNAKLANPPPGSRFAAAGELTDQFRDNKTLQRVENLKVFAAERGRSLLELAFSWLASSPIVCSVLAGASTAEQVRQNASACSWKLSISELDTIAELLA